MINSVLMRIRTFEIIINVWGVILGTYPLDFKATLTKLYKV